MLGTVFHQVLNMSYTASYVILAILLIRIPLKKVPKNFSYTLWSVALFRLVCPWTFESALSLLSIGGRTTEQLRTFPEQFVTLGTIRNNIDTKGNMTMPSPVSPMPEEPIFSNIFTIIWLLGVAALLIYSVFMLLKLKRILKGAVPETENIYLSEHLTTPFVMGVIHPKIYLPLSLSETEKRYILLHEQTHIRRLDHIFKLVSFFVLCAHWFNPLVWLAFFLSGRDMEMSCDEAVVKKLGNEVKKEYSTSLLTFSTGRRVIGGAPLAFGEGDTKSRIKNVLNYRKPVFWVVLLSVAVVLGVSVGLMTNPKAGETSFEGVNAVILEIDREKQSMTVKGVEENSVIGDRCILTWEADPFITVAANSGPKRLSLDDYSVGDRIVVFIGEVQESYPARAKAKTIQLQPKQSDRLIFWVKPDESMKVIGETAAKIWLKSYMQESVPLTERISDYKVHNVTVIAGAPKEGRSRVDMKYQYVVRMNYDIATVSNEYFAPGDGVSGKGTFQGLFREIYVKELSGKQIPSGNFEIVGAGTGGGAQEFANQEARIHFNNLSTEDEKLYQQLTQQRGLKEWQIHTLSNTGFALHDIISLSDKEIAEILAPGASFMGDTMSEEEFYMLVDSGMPEDDVSILQSLGYDYDAVIALTPEQMNFIFPNTELVDNLVALGYDRNIVEASGFLNDGGWKTYKELLDEVFITYPQYQ